MAAKAAAKLARAARVAENRAIDALAAAKTGKSLTAPVARRAASRAAVSFGQRGLTSKEIKAVAKSVTDRLPGTSRTTGNQLNLAGQEVGSKSMSAGKAAGTALGVITAREGIDKAIHSAAEAVGNVPVVGELARAGEDIAQVALNPYTWLASPPYVPYRLGSAVYNMVTGHKEALRPYDVRLTVGNAVEKLANSNIPGLNRAAQLASHII